jgi:phosphoglucomutase
VSEYGAPHYARIDAPATAEQKAALARLTPADVRIASLGGEPIEAILTHAPGNGAAIGGIKVVARNGWCAVRPSGTEDICKVYAESFESAEHLARIQEDAVAIVAGATA